MQNAISMSKSIISVAPHDNIDLCTVNYTVWLTFLHIINLCGFYRPPQVYILCTAAAILNISKQILFLDIYGSSHKYRLFL